MVTASVATSARRWDWRWARRWRRRWGWCRCWTRARRWSGRRAWPGARCWRRRGAGAGRCAGCGGRCGAGLGGRRRVVAVGWRRLVVARRRGCGRCRVCRTRIAVIPAQRARATVGRPASGDFHVNAREPMVARGADAHQCLAAREVVAAANERLHARAAHHRLQARPDGALSDHQVHLGADHVVAVGDVDRAATDHRARMPRAVEHDDDARIARLLVISVCDAWRDRQRRADTHAQQQRGPRNAVHEALTHDDLPAWPCPSVRGLADGARLRRIREARSSGGLCVEDRNRYGKTHAPYGERRGFRMADGLCDVYARFERREHAPNGGGKPVNRCQNWVCVNAG